MWTWIVEHSDALLTAFTAVVTAASAVANLTPTDSDNKVVNWISKVVNSLALNLKK